MWGGFGGMGGGGFGQSRRFEEQYHCYSVSVADKAHLEVSVVGCRFGIGGETSRICWFQCPHVVPVVGCDRVSPNCFSFSFAGSRASLSIKLNLVELIDL